MLNLVLAMVRELADQKLRRLPAELVAPLAYRGEGDLEVARDLYYANTYVGFASVWPSLHPNVWQLQIYEKEGKEAIAVSAKYMGDRKIPSLQFTAEEIKEVQTLGRDVDTYVDEWTHAFIRGQKPLAEWQAFQDGLKKLNTERLTALYETAYARYRKVAGL